MSTHLAKLFTGDDRAVAPIIGVILLFGIFFVGFAGYQAEYVPQQNAETEFQHYQDVQNDLTVVRNAISRAGQQNQDQFESVQLGTNYPQRILALNPPAPAGTLRTTDEHTIYIDNGTGDPEPVPTRFLEYRNGYNELNIEPIYYENSVLYLNSSESGQRVFFEDQNIVQDNGETVVITALQREFSRSAVGRITVELYPTDSGDPLPAGDEFEITLPTQLPETYWSGQLQGEGPISNFGYDDTKDPNQVSFNVSSEDLEFNTVGINDVPEETNSISDSTSDSTSDTPDEGADLSALLDITSLPGNGKYELDASGSSPSGEINEYRWDFDNDGSIDRTTTSATTTVNNGNQDVDDTGSARVVVVNTDTSPSTTASATEPYPFPASGDVTVKDGQTITRDIDTTGDVEVKDGGKVQGSIDSGGDITVKDGGEVQGSIDSGGNVTVKDGGEVQGSVDADGEVTVKEGGEVQGEISEG